MAAYVKIGKALPIGIVLALTGYALLKGTDGLQRLLHPGEPVHSDDQLSTGPDSSLTIGFADGSELNLGANSALTIDNQVFDPESFGGGEAGSVATSLEALQRAILAGVDPFAVLDGGDANIGESEGGHGTVRVPGSEGLTGGDVVPRGGADATGGTDGDTLPSDEEQDAGVIGDAGTVPAGGGDLGGELPIVNISDVVITEPGPTGQHFRWGMGGAGEASGHESELTIVAEEGHGDDGHDSGHSGGDTGESGGGESGGEEHGGSGGEPPLDVATAVLTVTLTAPATQAVTIHFTTVDGTAVAGGIGVDGADYGNTSGTLIIPAGETTGTIEVAVYGDRAVEGTEQFYVHITDVDNAILGDGIAVGTILDSGHGEGQFGEGATIIGSEGGDVISTGGGPDSIYGLGGDDHLSGGGGPDTIDGGEGDDLLEGFGGPDTLIGGEGNDVLVGFGGPDQMDGGSGDDILYGGGGPDTMLGGVGNDRMDGGGSPDYMDGGEGNDVMYGGGGPDTMLGGAGDDYLSGDGGPDVLNGGPGNDLLAGGGGSDLLVGGEGDDILIGGGAGDVFQYLTASEAGDTIVDFNPQQGDILNISDVLDNYTEGMDVADFVKIAPVSEDTYQVLVNSAGTGNDADYQLLVTLQNMQGSPNVDDLVSNGNLVV